MPELPEVATYLRFAEEAALYRTIVQVGVVEPRVVLLPVEELKSRVESHRIVGLERLGKQLFLKLSSGEYLTVHFGMTGSWELYRQQEEMPRFIKVFFVLDDGLVLGFRCPRILGRVGLCASVSEFQRQKKLGADALQVSPEEFAQLFKDKKGQIKPLLMNQRYLAGLGNWIVDEMLYQARIHPERRALELSKDELRGLYEKMQYILKLAIEHEVDYRNFPDSFLVTYRWYNREGHPLRNQDIQIKKVGGRTTYFDADLQK